MESISLIDPPCLLRRSYVNSRILSGLSTTRLERRLHYLRAGPGNRPARGVRSCASNATAITACSTTAGHSRTPWSVVATPTQANRIATPKLKTRRPNNALRPDPAAVEGRQAMPSASRPTRAKRASAIPTPSGLVANSSRHATPGAVSKAAPATISKHAAVMTTDLCSIAFSLEGKWFAEGGGMYFGQLNHGRTSMHTGNSVSRIGKSEPELPRLFVPQSLDGVQTRGPDGGHHAAHQPHGRQDQRGHDQSARINDQAYVAGFRVFCHGAV